MVYFGHPKTLCLGACSAGRTVWKRGSIAALASLHQERGITCHSFPQALGVGNTTPNVLRLAWLHVFNRIRRGPQSSAAAFLNLEPRPQGFPTLCFCFAWCFSTRLLASRPLALGRLRATLPLRAPTGRSPWCCPPAASAAPGRPVPGFPHRTERPPASAAERAREELWGSRRVSLRSKSLPSFFSVLARETCTNGTVCLWAGGIQYAIGNNAIDWFGQAWGPLKLFGWGERLQKQRNLTILSFVRKRWKTSSLEERVNMLMCLIWVLIWGVAKNSLWGVLKQSFILCFYKQASDWSALVISTGKCAGKTS